MIATAKVRKMKVVNKIGSIVKVQISESNGFCDSDTMVKIIYMVLGMKCISAYEKNDIFGVRVVITIFLHLISNTSYFVKKCTCKILGWLIYVLYEKKNDLCSSWLLSVEDG